MSKKITLDEIYEMGGKDVFRLLIKKYLKREITCDQLIEITDKWYESNGYINTDLLGWVKKDEIEEMGIYQDDWGKWHFKTKMIEEEKGGKNILREEAVQYNQFRQKKREEEEAKQINQENLKIFEEAKEILGGEEVE